MNKTEILNELKNIKQTMLGAELVKGQYMLWDLIKKIEQEEMKMISTTLADGQVLTGVNERDIIIQLKLEDFTGYNSVGDYQKNIAVRIKKFNGQQIKFRNDEDFLNELKRVGFISNIEK